MSDATSVTEGRPILPPEAKRREIPYLVTKLFLGADELESYCGKKDVCAIRWNGEEQPLARADYELVRSICDEIMDGYVVPSACVSDLWNPDTALRIHQMAAEKLERREDVRAGRRGIAMLKDTGGSGWWRMTHPARHMDMDGWYVDVTAAEVEFDHLLEYDVIFVQRLHDWGQYYMLEKLKKGGKRIVYDLDDDLFHIPPDNPASRVIGRDQQFAAMECMRLADAVTVSTRVIKERIQDEMGKEPIVIPNALDPDDGWPDAANTGSPDKLRRIFWQGSATHAEDWNQCAEAVDKVLKERDDVRLVILGFLPPIVQRWHEERPHWHRKVEYMEFSDPETYFRMLRHVRADVGLAPLSGDVFNQAKSAIKFVEYALIGIPTVASNAEPYSDVIEDKKSGRIASTPGDWYEAIAYLIERDGKRREMVEAARHTVRNKFDINKVVERWKEVLTGEPDRENGEPEGLGD